MLTGTPGTRKGTAIKTGRNLLDKLNYPNLAPNKAAKEAFWDWMVKNKQLAGLDFKDLEGIDLDDLTDLSADPTPTNAYIAHDEFLDFIGVGDDSFVTNLTNLWDNLPKFVNPKTRGKSITITQPTINILSGITPSGISEAFKSIAMGGGFFSRMIFVYSAPTSHKITWPELPCPNAEAELLTHLSLIQEMEGSLSLTPKVKVLLDKLYKQAPDIADNRFAHYSQRRFTHLLKLVLIVAAADLTLTPTEEHCILANTILYNTEMAMPSALGEYGKSKFADVANAILVVLNSSPVPMTLKKLWKVVARDLNKFTDLAEIVQGLELAERIQRVESTKKAVSYIPNNAINTKWDEGLVDFSLLRDEEHRQ